MYDAEITFAVKGAGRLIGENPVSLRAGKMIILAQAGFISGEIVVSARAKGLRPAAVTVKTLPVGIDVDMPQSLPASMPTARLMIVPASVTPLEAGARQSALAVPEPDEVAIKAKGDAKPGIFVESDPLLIPGLPTSELPIAIKGGEYRIYTSEWTDRPGKVIGGDAVYVRVRSAPEPCGTAAAELTIGDKTVRFEVRTHTDRTKPRHHG